MNLITDENIDTDLKNNILNTNLDNDELKEDLIFIKNNITIFFCPLTGKYIKV